MRQSWLAFKQLPPMGSFHWLLLQKASLPERTHHWCFFDKISRFIHKSAKSLKPTAIQLPNFPLKSFQISEPSHISTIPNSIANITDFCTGRHWIVDHTLHHLGCVDHLRIQRLSENFLQPVNSLKKRWPESSRIQVYVVLSNISNLIISYLYSLPMESKGTWSFKNRSAKVQKAQLV